MKNSSSSSSTQRKCAFARKCARLVKEQRARFYIMRHCVIMLICWHDCNFLSGVNDSERASLGRRELGEIQLFYNSIIHTKLVFGVGLVERVFVCG
ncbi:hypothetical protein JHK85_056137 [Glycine max]|nr:hypothetical protein JHK85_056137 [Glycine max]